MTDAALPEPTRDLPDGADIRLVVADLDGTLLDGDGRIPDGLWPLLERMRADGIAFAPASGRQYATLRALFDRAATGMPFIAENGTYVVRDGVALSTVTLDRGTVETLVRRFRELAAGGADIGVVVCGTRSAYVERADAAFLAEARKYYLELAVVDDLLAPEDDVLKLAVFDFADAETDTAPALDDIRASHQVVVSGAHWVDVMSHGVDKGVAVRALQRELGITAAQTAGFGDYLNDAQLIEASGWSFAMANAHPEILRRARFVAPANTADGVVTTLRRLLGY